MTAFDIHHSGVGRMSDAVMAGSVREGLGGAIDAFGAAGVDTPRLDAELLLAEATGWDRARLAADPNAGIPAAAGRRFAEMVRRRLRREPVAYILGRRAFRHIELAVDRRVLIPRPETELLVELALEMRPGRVLDVGTGSGAIALTIADELPGCEVVATDTSAAALEVARENAERLGLSERVELVEGTLPWAPLASAGPAANADPEVADGGMEPAFDLVVTNLPYVSEAEWGSLEPEVTRWEPREALLAGADGLDAIRGLLADPRLRRLSNIGRQRTKSPFGIALEVGAGQASAVGGLLRAAGFGSVETRRDLTGIERVVVGRG